MIKFQLIKSHIFDGIDDFVRGVLGAQNSKFWGFDFVLESFCLGLAAPRTLLMFDQLD